MPFEIDMLSVKNADASIIRYFNEYNEEIVIVIDAGRRKDGNKVVEHIHTYTNKKRVDLAICTHPDNDHIGGFFKLIEKVKIDEFWIHNPEKHIAAIRNLTESYELDDKIEKALIDVLENLRDSEDIFTLLKEHGIRTKEPLAGLEYNKAPLKIVGPTREHYQAMLSKFRDKDILLEDIQTLKKSMSLLEMMSDTPEEIIDAKNDKSAENNSSVIILFTPNDRRYLFTADAGPDALEQAHKNYDLSNIYWMQIPHHGSKYNITSSLIQKLNPKIAYISCETIQSMDVINVFKKQGTTVYSTCRSINLRHSVGLGKRLNYLNATPE
jgi:beta-lactamase superfamily II metal-dependent hydrolase